MRWILTWSRVRIEQAARVWSHTSSSFTSVKGKGRGRVHDCNRRNDLLGERAGWKLKVLFHPGEWGTESTRGNVPFHTDIALPMPSSYPCRS